MLATLQPESSRVVEGLGTVAVCLSVCPSISLSRVESSRESPNPN